jgi:hypothetical protein
VQRRRNTRLFDQVAAVLLVASSRLGAARPLVRRPGGADRSTASVG